MPEPTEPREDRPKGSGHDGGMEDNGIDVAASYAELFMLAATQPMEAIARWNNLIKGLTADKLENYEFHTRAFEKLSSRAQSSASEAISQTVSEKVEQSRAFLLSQSPVELNLTNDDRFLRAFSRGVRETYSFAVNSEIDPKRDLRDLWILEKNVQIWTVPDWMSWLTGAIRELGSSPNSAHLAFQPIKLVPGGRFIEQLSAILVEGDRLGLRAPAIIRRIAHSYFSSPICLDETVAAQHKEIWKLIALTRPRPTILTDARTYIIHNIVTMNQLIDIGETIVEQIISVAKHAMPISGAQSAFLYWLRRNKQLWRPKYIPVISDILIAEIEQNDATRSVYDLWKDVLHLLAPISLEEREFIFQQYTIVKELYQVLDDANRLSSSVHIRREDLDGDNGELISAPAFVQMPQPKVLTDVPRLLSMIAASNLEGV